MVQHYKAKVTAYALIPALLTPGCFFFVYGFNVGTTNAAAIPLQQFYSQSYLVRYGLPLPDGTLNLLWTLTSALYGFGGMFGCLLVRPLVAKFGSRATMVYSQIICLVGTLLMCISYPINSYESFLVGRFVLGIFCGLGIGIGPAFVYEISPFHTRGILGMCFTLFITISVLLANAFGLYEVLGTPTGWPYLIAITALPSIVFILYSPWFPQSPKALYLANRDREGAERVLKMLRGTDDVSEELEQLRQEEEASRKVNIMTVLQVLTSRHERWQLISAIVILGGHQLTGINGVHFNLNDAFVLSGISPDIAGYVTLGCTFFQVVVTFVAGFLSERFGRKPLLVIGNSIVCFSIVLYTFMSAFQTSVPWFSYVAIVAMLAFLSGFSSGQGPVAYSITPELLDQSARPAVMTLATLTYWFFLAVVGFATPYLFEYLTFGALLPYLGFTLINIIYTIIVIPETKGKSVVAIQAYFAKLNKVPIKDATNPHDNDVYDATGDDGGTASHMTAF